MRRRAVRFVSLAAASFLLSSAPEARAGMHVWSGAVSNLWSNAGNWAGGAPAPGEGSLTISFPPGALHLSNQNDIVGLTIDTLTFGDANYHVTGNAITLVTELATALTFTTGLSDMTNAIALTQPTTVTLTGTGLLELYGTISGGPGVPISISGAGALGLRGANTFQGPLAVDGSTLYVYTDGALGASSSGSAFSNGAGLVLQGVFNAEPLTFAGGTALIGASGVNGLDGAIVVAGPVTFTANSGSSLIVDGAVSGLGAPVLSGGGRIYFENPNKTYSGTTTDDGSSVTFLPGYVGDLTLTGAILAGSAQAPNVTAGAAATISPGDSLGGTGLLDVAGTLALTAGTQVVIDLNGTAPADHDRLQADVLDLGGSTLLASRGVVAALNDSFVIAQGGSGLSGTFAGLPDGAALSIGAQSFQIHYTANEATLTATAGTAGCTLDCTASGPTLIKLGTSADFTGSTSFSGPCASLRSVTPVEWSFGDTLTSSQQSPSHLYARAFPFAYAWKMTASALGMTCSKTGSVRVAMSGDVNGDTKIDVADVFYLINALFAGGAAPIGWADANGDTHINVGDVFYLINYLFASGPPPV